MYCDFYSLAEREESMDRFVQCLIREICLTSGQVGESQYDTIYLGGGTPSLLTPQQVDSILSTVYESFTVNTQAEITLECNPGEATEAWLRDIHELGINRLSIGFQSFDPDVLSFLGRRHHREDCFKTYRAARRVGLENISADLLFNIPGQSLTDWQYALRTLTDLEPEHISTYSLTVESGTPLYDQVGTGAVVMPSEEEDAAMYGWTREFLPRSGYEAYEISNFTRANKACRHNLHYWHIEPYLGFGPSAHAFDGQRRTWNVHSLDTYMTRLEKGDQPQEGEEMLSPRQKHNEKLAFGLRLSEGVSVIHDLGYSHVEEFTSRYEERLVQWAGHLLLRGDRLILLEPGIFLADTVIGDLILDEDEADPGGT
ncbi:MAG: radical SAM family heme chaperone HemW [Fidelibacterota bacterium]|nr:MAG: radical SAM family heme chaperone HemW [Candidatus Neomarinimicrobiota bacterium]